MLALVSDLHFVNETAGKHNVPTTAFEMVFEDLVSHANKAKSEEVKIVLVGDIFDLLRTEKWFDVSVDERPWGDKREEMEKNATEIFNRIANKNRTGFFSD